MLKVASFPITDAEGINELTSKYRLAAGMHILVSEGQICIPYEDGEPETPALQVCNIREQINTIIREMAIIEHSQLVMDQLLADALERKNVAEAKHKAALSDKKLEAKFKEAESAHDQLVNHKLMNQHELKRLQTNIDFYQEKIKSLAA